MRRGLLALTTIVLLALVPAEKRGCGAPPDQSENADPRLARWRRVENEGINCLFLQLRRSGYDESYETFLKSVPEGERFDDMASLARLAKRFGYHLVPVKSTLDDLERAAIPAIVHVENERVGEGTFGLLISTAPDRVTLVEGATVSVVQRPRDDFLRTWSGFALVPGRESRLWAWTRRAAAGFLAAWAIGLVLFRWQALTRKAVQ